MSLSLHLGIARLSIATAVLVGVALYIGIGHVATSGEAGAAADPLRPVSSFSSITEPPERSAALFTEAARVIQSPRCLNCHPVDRTPTQGDKLLAHQPFVTGATDGHGPPGLPCGSCHQAQNVSTLTGPIASIPGDAHWGLAPLSMGWQGKSVREICEQLKDPNLNGGRSLAAIEKHMLEDTLVGWAWNPGEGRTPAPGTQQQFGALIKAWIETGAHCPPGQ